MEFNTYSKTITLFKGDTLREQIQAIETYIYHYNYKRFQKRLNHRAPIEYRISMAA
ncbi:IS3 family transposase [Bacillus cereus group sp. N21]|uniref:IS3 family transposase n=1 Tax=Bacillus cereus group sp. N21 TaxID=2794591 RepID=UPI001A7E9CBF